MGSNAKGSFKSPAKIEGEISSMIELHTHTNNNGVMQMREVESSDADVCIVVIGNGNNSSPNHCVPLFFHEFCHPRP